MKLIKSQSGMSLIEIMVAVSILSVIMVSVMMLGKNMDKSAKNAEKKGDIEQYMREINTLLSNKANCSASVIGAVTTTARTGTYPSHTPGSRTMLTSLKTIDSNGKIEVNPRLQVKAINSGDKNNQVIINGMYLEYIGQTFNGGNFELVITFVKNPSAAAGNTQSQGNVMQNYVRKVIPLQLDTCGRTIKSAVYPSQPTCSDPITSVVTVSSSNPTPDDVFNLIVCRDCATRGSARGCL